MNEYRCSLPDCKSLLFKGSIIHARIEVLCKCGAKNVFEVIPQAEAKPEGREANRKMNGRKFRHESPSA